MATLALGVGGAALFGSFAAGGGATIVGLGLTAAQVGFAVGSLAGSIVDAALFAPDTPTPKVPEQRVQGFAYGADIKQVLGTDRVAGTLLWVKGNKIDSVRRRRGGGAGPFGKAAAPDEIERVLTCRVGICTGPIDGVIAIWANGKAIYDVRSDPTSGAPGVFRADGVDFTIYRGTGTEEPDPDEEADRGAGNAPGYRHWASIVFRNLPLGNSAQVPLFEFLVAAGTGETETGLQKTIYSGTIPESTFGSGWSYDDGTHTVWLGTSELITGELVKINLWTDETDDTVEHVDLGVSVSDPPASNSAISYITGGPVINRGLRPYVYLLQKGLPGGSGNDTVYEVDEVAVRTRSSFASGLESQDHGIVARAGETDYLILWSRAIVADAQLLAIDLTAGGVITGRYTQSGAIEAAVMRGTEVYALMLAGGAYILERFTFTPSSADPDEALRRTFQLAIVQASSSDPPTAMRYLPDEDIIIVAGGSTGLSGNLHFYDVSSGAPVPLLAGSGVLGTNYADHQRQALQAGIHEGVLWLLQADGETVDKIDVVNRKRLDQFDLSALAITADEVCYEPRGNSLIVREGGTLKRVFLGRVGASAVTLGTAITTIGAAAGLAAGDFDVSALSGIELDGMTLNAQAPARQWIATLMRAFFLSAAETGGKIRFRLLDDTADKAVDADDLGAGEGRGAETALQLTRLPDTELPTLIEVSYRDVDENHEPAMQTAEHPVFTGARRSTIGIDAVLDRDRAKRLAVAFLYQAHLERERIAFALPWSYLEVEPGDILSVPHNGNTLTLRLTRTHIGAVIECEAVPAVNLFDGTEAGAEPALPEPGVTGLADTEMFLFDIPFLRDGDRAFEEEGIYIGAAPSEPSLQWNGARITRATTAGDALGEVARVFGDAAWGALITPPPEPLYPGWQTGELTLRLVAGDLSSATLTQLLLNQANLALIAGGNPATTGGWEALQFLTATDEGGGVWRLGGRLLRGIRGSDPWMTHEAGDRIVIVSAADLERVGHTAAATFEYFALTFGKQTGFGTASDRETLKSRDHARKCWAPRNVRGTRDSSDNLTLTWSRRARLNGQLTDTVGTPLIEASEAYEVDVLNGPGGDVLRTIASGITTGTSTDPWSATVTYSAADQTTDGLTPGDPVTVMIYQIGAAGRGLAVESTV